MSRHEAALAALYDAADDDSATGGPDINRRIFPSVSLITEDGFERLSEPETEELSQEMVGRPPPTGRPECRSLIRRCAPLAGQSRTPTSRCHLTNCLSGSPVYAHGARVARCPSIRNRAAAMSWTPA